MDKEHCFESTVVIRRVIVEHMLTDEYAREDRGVDGPGVVLRVVDKDHVGEGVVSGQFHHHVLSVHQAATLILWIHFVATGIRIRIKG